MSNPNGANQHKPDPRQAKFLEYYLTPDSKTFGDAKNSGIRAGFSESYSKNLTNLLPSWLSDNIDDSELVAKAQKNLKEFLDIDKDDPSWLRIKKDATEFVLERLNKAKYSKRTEVTGKGGEDLFRPSDEEKEKANEALNAL